MHRESILNALWSEYKILTWCNAVYAPTPQDDQIGHVEIFIGDP